ncbi:hypothetical protein J3Q64DRAFT_1860379 [Phycomyces blakesleeanus]|uniref:F-box domain-containing protein n=2 Tax=Phycomyces blakesleeanus TaxID=4837 RepID=A0A167MMD9_PHYB8|nr:hypothetical protein PHYBLDRAFT_65876 [Phycomyces blakesleeanus NRRL 1555(-)]OAD73274.1 hypothetical protein PHYBLDRAFT_65876 [Phycomyces blakesleeanus NRRL 1555(-)]|eukprot:XP_018291314.1 hypothetical protein PHYBLDRAFT_65876 [Phycomyces blakesleeanus NRRL 1555(-)]
MGVSELPLKILMKIADNLSILGKHFCSLTCKRWRHPFQKCLLRNIVIGPHEGAQVLVSLFKASGKNAPTLYGLNLWIHSLQIHHYFDVRKISDMHFSDLFGYLQNLKHLDLWILSSDDIYGEVTRTGAGWKSLESLKIQYSMPEKKWSARDMFECINTCSMLQKLKIHKHGEGYYMDFSLDDFEKMHQSLQELSSIEGDMYLNTDFSSTLDALRNMTPEFAMTSLDIRSKKYEMNDDATDVSDNHTNLDKGPKIRSLFRSNPNAFKHLETFDFTTDNYYEFSDLILWDLLCPLKVPLKHLALNALREGKVDDSNPIDINRILQSFSETLERLSVQGFAYSDNVKNQTLEISYYCPFLRYLFIGGSEVYLNVADLLDKCVGLKELKIRGGKLFINPTTPTEESNQHHGLEILKLQKCSATAEAFSYISFRCRGLKHMTLHTFWVPGSICEETGCLLVDMPYTFLKTLNIGQGQYGISRNVSFGTSIGLKKKEMDLECPIMTSPNIDWLYTFDYYVYPGTYVLETRKLSREYADVILEYYQNFQSNSIDQITKDNSSYDVANPETGWEYDLYRGYGELRFGNIESISVISEENDDTF